MKKKVLLLVTLALAIIVPVTFASAADYLPKDKNSAGSVVVGGAENYHNLYVAGGSVLVNKVISGDLFAAGGSVNVAAEIGGDLFAVGGNVTVANPVSGDARLGGGNIVINAPVSGDVLAGGGTILFSSDAIVGGDLWIGGGVVNFTSRVAGDAKIAGGEVFINGFVAGQLEIQAEKLIFGPEARVSGPISYKGSSEAIVQDGAQVGEIEFSRFKVESKSVSYAGFLLFALLKFLTMLVAGLIVYRLSRKSSRAFVALGYKKFWSGLGLGLVGIIVTPVVAVILMITVVGAFAGLILLFGFILSLMISAVYSLMLIGATLEKWIRKEKEVRLTWLTVLWGVLAGEIIFFIPFVGGLVLFVFYLATFGTLLRSLRKSLEV